MLGVVPAALIGGKGTVWMLGTEEVYQQGRALLTNAPIVFNDWLGTFTRLENVIMVENRRAIRLLKRWGYQFGEAEQIHGGERFVPFWMQRAIQAPPVSA